MSNSSNATWKRVLLDSSTFILLVSNLAMILLAVLQDWSLSTIIWTYWIQSIVIGVFNTARIFTLNKFSTEGMSSNGRLIEPSSNRSKIENGFFFLFHYGFFHAGYALFLWSNFKDINLTYLGLGAVLFFINHLFSYLHNRQEDENKVPHLGHIMAWPYLRIIPMHLTIVFLGNSIKGTGALIMFLLLKTFADVLMHLIEHKKRQTGKPLSADLAV